jgi:hypothetical protein
VVDVNGGLVTDFKTKIQLQLADGGKLEGGREKDTQDGIATFDDLKVDKPGSGSVLQAFAPDDGFLGIVQSQPFNVEED